mgnify:CR=1 FL=1
MGLLSKIFGGIKKVIRGVGKVIKKVTKPIRKVLRKVLKPIGKVFDKLGFVGTLALSFLLPPGFGQAISSWFGNMGSALMTGITNVAPNVGAFISKVGTAIAKGATYVKEGMGNVFSTITDGIKSGVNAIAKPFGFDASVAGGRSFTDAFSQGLDNLMGRTPEVSSGGYTTAADINQATGGLPTPFGGGVSDAIDTVTTVAGDVAGDVAADTPGLMSRVNTGIDAIKDTTAVQFASNVAQGKSIYDKYTYEEPSYFRNNALDDAAGLIQQAQITSQTPIDALSFSGEPLQAQDNFYSLASKYIAGAGYAQPSQGTDMFNFANNLPGYGYQFANFLEDSLYDSAGFAATNYTEQAKPKGGY